MGRGLRLVAAIALAAVLALGAGGAGAQVPDAFGGISGVTVRYYDVAGISQSEINAAMRAARPTDPADGRRVDALTRTALHWSWPVRDGRCRLEEAAVTFGATVTLPRLADPAVVPAEVKASWATYLTRIEAHELVHLRYGYDGRLEVLAAIKGATCETADAGAKAALAAIQQRDLAFDRTTDHGDRGPETGL